MNFRLFIILMMFIVGVKYHLYQEYVDVPLDIIGIIGHRLYQGNNS